MVALGLALIPPALVHAQDPGRVMQTRPTPPRIEPAPHAVEEPSRITLMPRELGRGAGPHARCGGVRLVLVEPSPEPDPPTDAGVNIVLTFDSTVPASHRPIYEFVAAEWESILLTNGLIAQTFPITVEYLAIPGETVAQALVFFESNGRLQSATIETDIETNWYVDPTPADSSEFTPGGGPAGTDLVSVIRHEMGHCLGWLSNSYMQTFTAGSTFDALRTNIALSSPTDRGHASVSEHPGELMQPTIQQGVRRSIALYPTVALVARAYNVRTPVQFVDPAFSGSSDGRAAAPWRTLVAADAGASPNIPLFLAPTTHQAPTNTLLDRPGEIRAVRGGAILTTP
jgi:hypothetical protein